VIAFRINAVTQANRYEATTIAEEVLASLGGFILDHHLYSNVSTVLNVELQLDRIDELVDHLAKRGFTVSSSKHIESRAQAAQGTLQITFVHDEPDIRHEVPAVPG
jgi:hypothetical protein